MTDREKLEAVFIAFDVPIEDSDHSFVAADRRYYFDEEGVLTKVVDRGIM